MLHRSGFIGTAAPGAQIEIAVALPVTVSIDIKPGGTANSINPRSQGNTPVAILSGPGFNALADVDVPSLTFGRTGDERSLAFCSGGEDVNGDGLLVFVC